MESTLITGLPLLVSPSKSRPVSPLAFAGARRLASVSFSSSSGCGVLCSRGGEYAGVGSSVSAAAAALGEAAEPGSEAILLSVQGMMCDGCAASVKRILESQPEVSSATVDFKEAKAVVWTTPEVKVTVDWQKQCGEKLANHLGACGFESRLQDCYPNVSIAYRILLTVPVTVASAERSFSKLKLLKNCLMSTMLQERLNGLAMCSIEKDALDNINLDTVLEDFASRNVRRRFFKKH